MKKRDVRAIQRERKNTPLVILLLILVPLYGGYYNAFAFAAGTVLACVLLGTILRTGTLVLPDRKSVV